MSQPTTKPLTCYESVQEFHEVFGHPNPNNLQNNIFVEDPTLVNFRVSLITEEVNELIAAVKDQNMTEVMDALGDISYVVNGMAIALGIDLDKVFDIVHASNMSKLCVSEREAQETVEYYKTQPGFENVTVQYRESCKKGFYVIYNVATGKILKSINFRLPNFEPLMM